MRGAPNRVRIERVFVPIEPVGPVALARAPPRAQVAADELLELVVRDRWIAGSLRLRPSFDGVHDERKRTTWFEDVVDDFRDGDLVRPLERLPERHELERAEVERGDGLGHRLEPVDVVDPCFDRTAGGFGEHVRIGIKPDRLVERRRQLDREDAGTASDVE